jgi:murein DD-endopeptidase MepM/ murein hydrolase activator NlpD
LKKLGKDKKNIKNRLIFVGGAFLLAAVMWLSVTVLEGKAPDIRVKMTTSHIGTSRDISGTIVDSGTGLRNIRMTIVKEGQAHVLHEADFPSAGLLRGGTLHETRFSQRIDPDKIHISDGEALLRIEARDHAWRGWWHGNRGCFEKSIVIDTCPPEIEVMSRAHNIQQGGSGLIIYRVSETGTRDGVHVGEHFFPGHAGCFDDDTVKVAFFALGYQQGRDTKMYVTAEDQAGNSSKAGFYHYIKGQQFQQDLIRVSDNFLERKLPEFKSNDSGNPQPASIEKFLGINRQLRVENTRKLLAISQNTDPALYWQGAFLRLPRAATRAMFGDQRSYQYKENIIDHQIHLGIDLASLRKSPVPAANTGRVAFTGDVGIYGKTVVLDHGFGLFSLYSHLSRIHVQQDEQVEKGAVIGRTGQTGMAGGDHLHYGMFVHDVFVNPLEWWDASWIKNNVTSKIEAVKAELRKETSS